MPLSSYSDLVDEIGNFLNRTDLSSRIPTFIKLAEARFNRTLRTPEMIAVSTSASSSETVALPSDFIAAQSLYINSDPDIVLEAMAFPALRETYASATTGEPEAYAIRGSNIIVGPPPDASYTYTLVYYQTIPALTSGSPTNWLLTAHPDIYLYASLCMSQAYIVDPERLEQWKVAWDEATAEVMRHANAQRLPGGPLTMRPTVIE